MLKPIRHSKLSDQIFEQLRDMIYRGEIDAGQRLMPERELAIKFGVGRPSVREALRKLSDQGLIYSKRGAGSFVSDKKTQVSNGPLLKVLIKEDFTITELQEVRVALESKSAELAAKRATDSELIKIQESEQRMRQEQGGGKARMRTDLDFHMNIAYASHNTVQIHLMKIFYDVLLYAMVKAYDDALQSVIHENWVDRQHMELVEAISKRDPIMARQAMEAHISMILEFCQKHEL